MNVPAFFRRHVVAEAAAVVEADEAETAASLGGGALDDNALTAPAAVVEADEAETAASLGGGALDDNALKASLEQLLIGVSANEVT